MKLPTKEELEPLGWTIAIFTVIAILGMIFTPTSLIGMFTLLFAFLVYFVVPGYAVMLNFNFSAFERVILGMVVSSAVVPVVVYTINILGLKVSTINVLFSILAVTIAAIVYRKDVPKKTIENKKDISKETTETSQQDSTSSTEKSQQ